jgi:hypothetical protein
MQEQQTTPDEIIVVLNRSYQTTRESNSRDTRDAAQKAFDNCCNWLRARGIPFHQTARGEWVLDEMSKHSEGHIQRMRANKDRTAKKNTKSGGN